MTSNEILKADVLDILFENRNKQYGAYALRKYYNNRMALALGLSLAPVLLACLLIRPSEKAAFPEDSLHGPVVLMAPPPDVEPPAPPPPPPAAQAPRPIATQAYLNRIEIVAQVDPNDLVPDLNQLEHSQIGSVTQAGEEPTQSRTIEPPPAPPAEAPAPRPQEPEAVIVDQQPEFPGGLKAWSSFLMRYLRAPEELQPGERKTVKVKFWVGEDGSVTRLEVVQSAGAVFDNEVLRVLKKMPKWRPALQKGRPIAVTFTQPVIFEAFEE